MTQKTLWVLSLCMVLLLFGYISAPAQQETMPQQEGLSPQQGGPDQQNLPKEELAQLLAPIALYPDEVVAQILMASTYPLEVVQADRWAKSHKQSTGEVLAKELEKEKWDPSVKSLVNFPAILSKMSEKLDLTSQIGEAFLSQQKDVMDTIQDLRRKAYQAGNLKTTKEQQVVVEKETIVIKPADPEVVYVPSYSPTLVYGTWPYPAYPPYYYYPPPPPAYPPFYFATGVAVGTAWGYAWGHCDWHGGSVNYNVNQNINVNRGINRSLYTRAAQGTWQHNPQHRRNVAYRNSATAQRYGQYGARTAQARGAAARGYAAGGAGFRGGAPARAGTAPPRRESAFATGSSNGRQERMASDRGVSSRQSAGPSTFQGSGAARGAGAGGSYRGGAGAGGGFRGGVGGFHGGGGRR